MRFAIDKILIWIKIIQIEENDKCKVEQKMARNPDETKFQLQRDRMLKAAAYCFNQKGYSGTSLKDVADILGPVDILINNAAENELAPISEYKLEDWERGIDVNLTGCFHLIRGVLPAMMDRGWGAIVNVTSVAAWLPGGGREGPYAAAKAALHSLTRSVAWEAGPRGVRCNAVAPGIIHSKFVTKYQEGFEKEIGNTPLRRIGDAAEVANTVSFLVSEESSFITGEIVDINGGLHLD